MEEQPLDSGLGVGMEGRGYLERCFEVLVAGLGGGWTQREQETQARRSPRFLA